MMARLRLPLLLALAIPALPVPAQAPAQAAPGGVPVPDVAPPADAPWLSLSQLRAKYGDAKGRIARIGGVEVYYKDEGKRPATLLIHGSVSSLKTYDGLAAQLRRHYRVIRFDVPPQGFGGGGGRGGPGGGGGAGAGAPPAAPATPPAPLNPQPICGTIVGALYNDDKILSVAHQVQTHMDLTSKRPTLT